MRQSQQQQQQLLAAHVRGAGVSRNRVLAHGPGHGEQSAGNQAQSGGELEADSKRIAIVEDEEDLLALISMMVTSWNHTVVMSTADAESLIKAISEREVRPQIVLMDYRLRGMNGLEAARRILRLDPSIRVIMVTADDGIKHEATEAGIGFLQKPFRSAQLEQVLTQG